MSRVDSTPPHPLLGGCPDCGGRASDNGGDGTSIIYFCADGCGPIADLMMGAEP